MASLRITAAAVLTGLFLAGPALAQAPDVLEPVPVDQVHITGGFWKLRQDTNRDVTIMDVFRKCERTGRIANFARAAGRETGEHQGYFFNDSDVYKNIQAAAISLRTHPDPKLEAYLDQLIELIEAAQWDDGYLYTFYSLPQRQPEQRWTNIRQRHELYCAGHLFEAAVDYHLATGKDRLLNVATRFADYIDQVFGPEGHLDPPGHEEIELALVRLYRHTGQHRYLELAEFFLDQRGNKANREIWGDHWQDHALIVNQDEAHGHVVRFEYMMAGVADVYMAKGGEHWLAALDRLWDNVASAKQYVTGGLGHRQHAEGFAAPFEMPNDLAYGETCGSIANAMWNHRMFLIHRDARYLDIAERVLYNGFLSGVSLHGDHYFYTNPLAVDSQERPDFYACACCPPNITRTIAGIGEYIYAVDGHDLFVNLYVDSHAKVDLDGREVQIVQRTQYPWDHKVELAISPAQAGTFALNLRIPGWARGQAWPTELYRFADQSDEQPRLLVNDEPVPLDLQHGFVRIDRQWRPGDKLTLELPMPVRRVIADPRIEANRGRVALQRGPIVYCAEFPDNPDQRVAHLLVDDAANVTATWADDLLNLDGAASPGVKLQLAARALDRVPESDEPAAREIQAGLIPFAYRSHRGPGQMMVWLAAQPDQATPTPLPTIASTAKPSASHCYRTDSVKALNDQQTPKGPKNNSIARMTWYSHKGTAEWVQYDFPQPTRLSRSEVYWFDDTGRGQCRVPAAWQLQYWDGQTWQPVQDPSPYTLERDQPNPVTFKPVTTEKLRLTAQLQQNFSAGILEWTVE